MVLVQYNLDLNRFVHGISAVALGGLHSLYCNRLSKSHGLMVKSSGRFPKVTDSFQTNRNSQLTIQIWLEPENHQTGKSARSTRFARSATTT
jgi:hypothetical protein